MRQCMKRRKQVRALGAQNCNCICTRGDAAVPHIHNNYHSLGRVTPCISHHIHYYPSLHIHSRLAPFPFNEGCLSQRPPRSSQGSFFGLPLSPNSWSADRRQSARPFLIQPPSSLFPAKTGTKEHRQLKIPTINNTTPALCPAFFVRRKRPRNDSRP